MKIIPVILAGGRGERFWPLSRIQSPKQCLPLLSENPMIYDTFIRLQEFRHFYVVASQFLCKCFKSILPEHVNYIEEPDARGTAAAIGLTCITLMKDFGDCILFFDTADHHYIDQEHYLGDVKKACQYAEVNNQIVLIGIKPTSPHTGYGYIKSTEKLDDQIYQIEKFKEKPDLETAKKYVSENNYHWNSGMLIAKCSVILKEMELCLPNLYASLIKIQKQNFDKSIIENEYRLMEKISIDYGISEKSQNIVLLRSEMPWDDIGDFNAYARIHLLDTNNNYGKNIHTINAQNNIVISKKLVGLIGVKDLIVVETDDAILVVNRNDTQQIRDLLNTIDPKYH